MDLIMGEDDDDFGQDLTTPVHIVVHPQILAPDEVDTVPAMLSSSDDDGVVAPDEAPSLVDGGTCSGVDADYLLQPPVPVQPPVPEAVNDIVIDDSEDVEVDVEVDVEEDAAEDETEDTFELTRVSAVLPASTASLPASPFAGPEALPATLRALQSAQEVILDFETTALTPWSAPAEAGTTKKIGGATVSQLKKRGFTFESAPRARVLSLYLPEADYKVAFDLDLLIPAEKASLAEALTGKVWIGHNLGFDLQWMLTLNPACRPGRIIDTMLLTTACRPSAELEMQSAVVKCTLQGNPEKRKYGTELHQYLQEHAAAAKGDKEDGTMSLKALSLWLLDAKMDKQYQKPQNWMVDQLSAAHYDYCMGDVETPGRIVRRLLNLSDDAPLSKVLSIINAASGGAAYKTFESALYPLAQMQIKGIPWSSEVADNLSRTLAQEAQSAADDLVRVAPSLAMPLFMDGKPTKKNPNPDRKRIDIIETLLDQTRGISAPIKFAIAEAIKRETGREVPESENGGPTLDAKTLAFNFPDSKVVSALTGVQSKSKARSMISKYAEAAHEGRLHPMTSIGTVTGRTSSQEPALQQVPRDPRFRAIFAARPGYKILATDFSSIELRIAAALSVRAWRELQSLVAQTKKTGLLSGMRRGNEKAQKNPVAWLFRSQPDLLLFLQSKDMTVSIPPSLCDVDKPGRDAGMDERGRYIAADLAKWVYKIRQASGGDESRLPFRAAYTHGIDPHLLTAVAMQSRGGHLDLCEKTPLEYMQNLSAEDAKALKGRMKNPRQAAKAVNFGSIYGQQSIGLHRYGVTGYGLRWTVEEASEAHAAWFDLYPEIGLWHWMLKYVHNIKANIMNPYNIMEPQRIEDGGKIYKWSTLSGRPAISSKTTKASSYQDQGTGAEIALNALITLPPDIQDMLVNFVHDEFVLEVPDERIVDVQETVERVMVGAADKLLLPFGIPTEVESSIGDCWIH